MTYATTIRLFFFFNDPAPTEIYTLPLHDALPIFIRLCGMTHVKTSPYYPQSNGKIERWHRILKEACIRPGTPLTPEDARRIVGKFVEHHNTVRWHSAIGSVTPRDKLEGRDPEIFAARDRKREAARDRRKAKRHAARQAARDGQPATWTT